MANVSRRGAMLGAAGLLVSSRARAAAKYPDRPVKIIVGFAPAGPTDIMARIIAAQLGERLGGSFIVENRPGAGGNIGMAAVAHAEPDGYTLLLASSTVVVNPALYKRLPFDPVKDLAPISELGTSPNVFVANPASGIASIADLIAKAKAQPDLISYGTPGIGTTPHLSGEMLKLDAGIKMTHVPYSGAGPAIQDVLAGTTQLACTALAPAQPHIATGALKGLAVTGEKRWPELPNVPTMVELGYKDIVTDTFQGFFAPARTPPDIQATLLQATTSILHDKAVADQLFANGFEVLATQPDEFRRKVEADIAMWREVIAKAGIPQV